ncbi:MAG: methyl-accepting chemotaxis protein [Planctomycetaceae bacterium]
MIQRLIPPQSDALVTENVFGSSSNAAPVGKSTDPSEVAAARSVLESLERQIRATATDLQDSLLKVSGGFGGIASRARQSVEIAQQGLAPGDGRVGMSETVHAIQTTLHGLLSSIRDSSEQSRRFSFQIHQLEQVLREVNQSLTRVEGIAEEARIVGLNGRLEAARAGAHGAAFSVVANESKNLASNAAQTSASIRGCVRQLDTALKKVAEQLNEQIRLDSDVVSQNEVMVNRLLMQLGMLHEDLTGALMQTQRIGSELGGEISRTITGLQFQDRINQQLDHIAEAIDAVERTLEPFESVASPARVARRARDWKSWLEQNSTMQSERSVVNSDVSGSVTHADFGSVELF